jgi:hypothetical protein
MRGERESRDSSPEGRKVGRKKRKIGIKEVLEVREINEVMR